MRNSRQILTTATVMVTIAALATQSARAQDSLFVTSVSNPAAAWLEDADGTRWELGIHDKQIGEIRQGVVNVDSGQQIMLFAESGSALILLGPARLSYAPTAEKNQLVLENGRLAIATVWPESGLKPPVVTVPADASGVPVIEAVVCPGFSYYERTGATTAVAFVSDTGVPPSMALTVLGQARSIDSGQMISVTDGNVQAGPADAWLTQSQFDMNWGLTLGVASAQSARPALESTLFSNISGWDVFGGQKYVTSRLEAGRFRPEIRQVASSVSIPQRSGTTPKGAPQTSPIAGANEVPFLSPAALSVINPTEGVTAIQLNAQASQLLTATGSRGLGFRGLARLAIAGTFGDGIPTIGPSGLGSD